MFFTSHVSDLRKGEELYSLMATGKRPPVAFCGAFQCTYTDKTPVCAEGERGCPRYWAAPSDSSSPRAEAAFLQFYSFF